MIVYDWIVEPFTFDFMVRALLMVVVSGVVTAVLSCWLVLVGWALMGDAVSHAVLPGVALAALFGLPFSVGALVFGVLAVALIGVVRDTSRIKEDAAMGVVFTALFSLGLVLVAVFPSQQDIVHILFGNVLGVHDEDLIQVIVISAVVLTVLLTFRKDLTLFAFDRVHAHSIGLSTRKLSIILLGSLALATVAGLQTVGVILVVAMLIVPGATAQLLVGTVDRMIVVASFSAILSGVAGIYLSFYQDLPPGPVIVLVQAGQFALAYLFAPRGGIVSSVLARRRARSASLLSTQQPVPVVEAVPVK